MTRRLSVLLLLLSSLLVTSCGTRSAVTRPLPESAPGRITISVQPNPIVARRVSGSTFTFAFDVLVREVGGAPVEVTRVTLDVRAIGGLRIASETYDQAEIRKKGFSPAIAARGERRYHFEDRRDVGDERLLSTISAELTVDIVDASGTPSSARTTVTVQAK